MKSSEAVANAPYKVEHSNVILKELPAHLGIIVISFFLSFQTIMGSISPFGVAFVSASKSKYMPAALIGSILGYSLSPGDNIMPLRYIATLVAVAVVVRCLESLNFIKSGQIATPLVAFFCSVATGVTVIVAQSFDMYVLTLYIAEAVIAGGSAYFFKMAMNIKNLKKGIYSISSHELAGVVVCTSILLMSFTVFEFGGFSPARVLCVLIILICSYFAREAGGSITGITLGLVIGIACKSQGIVIGYAFGGLLAGVFAPLGAIGVSCAFLIAHGVSIILQGLNAEVAIQFAEAVVACIIFIFLPSSITERIRLLFSCASIMPSIDGIKHSLVTRLCVASDAVTELSSTVDKVSSILSKKSTMLTYDDLFERVQSNVCKSCGNRAFCWEHCFNDTMNVFNDSFSVLRSGNRVSNSTLPKHFTSRCIKLTALVESFNNDYGIHTANISANAKLSQMRLIVAQQFESLATLLKDLSEDFDEERTFDCETASRADALLDDFGITSLGISCLLDRFSRMRIEIRCENITEKIDRFDLTADLCELCCRDFELPTVTVLENETLINFCERARFNISSGVFQYQCQDEQYCGDYYECFFDGRGRYIMIISDGMGTGTMAAVDSRMTVSLISQLIRSGFGFECALKVINSALMVKSGDESLATLDLVCIDLFSGVADFYKAGAAATLVKHGKKISKLEKVALPIGILQEVEFSHSTATLNDGDVILMSSDGAWIDEGQFIATKLKSFDGANPGDFSQEIADEAREKYKNSKNDDITVLTAVVQKNM
ncbi:MAG: SpoIIE family protein phosphatase [Oscillospiraceae bacterium]